MLTDQQTEVLRFIRRYTADNRHTPTPRDIAEQLGLCCPRSVAAHLNALHRMGCIRWTPGVPHSIKLPTGESGLGQLLRVLLGDMLQPSGERRSEPALALAGTAASGVAVSHPA